MLRDFLSQLDQRQRRLRDLAHAEEENRQIVAMLIHNARNQVAGLSGIVEMIGTAENLADMERVRALVQEGREHFRQAVVSFSQLTDLAMRLALSDSRFEPRLKEMPVEQLYLEVLRHYPAELVLMGDWRQASSAVQVDIGIFHQVLENLVNNAFKYGHPRAFPLRICFDVQAGRLQVLVEDRGEGFQQPEDLLFQLGYRGEQSGRVAGHGLGLAFCKRMIGRMGGKVFARNNDDGVGATFGFDLPIYLKKD